MDNPKNLEFQELEAATIPSVLADVDLAVINSNYALGAGLNPTTDALAIESSDSPYVNVLVVKEGNENNELFRPWWMLSTPTPSGTTSPRPSTAPWYLPSKIISFQFSYAGEALSLRHSFLRISNVKIV